MTNGVRNNPNYPTIEKSTDLYRRATGLIPAYTQTLAKGPGQYVNGVAPKYLQRAQGSHVWDVRIHDEKDRLVCVSRVTIAVLSTPMRY